MAICTIRPQIRTDGPLGSPAWPPLGPRSSSEVRGRAWANHGDLEVSRAPARVRKGHSSGEPRSHADVCFSNRPFWVKRLQTIHHCSVDVAHGLVLLFGIGTKALPSWDSKTRWNNLSGGLTVRRTAGPSDRTNSPHPSSREGHHSNARWSSSFLAMWGCELIASVAGFQRSRFTNSRRPYPEP